MNSYRQDLTFSQLRIFYEENNLKLSNHFKKVLELVSPDDKLNYLAYLLSDDNGTSIKVAKYHGINKVELIENEEFGFCCLIKAAKNVLNKFELENITRTKITSSTRLEKKLVDPSALREAIINAIVHNDYSREVPLVFEIFSDRIVITSYGGLTSGLTEEKFFNCCSMPRNRELMRIFKDVNLVEQLGSGMERILSKYDKSIFNFSGNFMKVTFKFYEGFEINDSISGTINGIINGTINEIEKKVFKEISYDNSIQREELSSITGYSVRTISRNIKSLKEKGYIKRLGSKKTGKWQILK